MSREITLKTEREKLESKFIKEMGDSPAADFIKKHAHMTKEELEARVLDLAKTHQGILNTRNADTDLSKRREEVRDLSKGYNEQLRGNKNLTRYVSLLISENFGDELMDLQTSTTGQD
jgi:hypothetical protein